MNTDNIITIRNKTFITAAIIFIVALVLRLLHVLLLGSEERMYDSLFDQFIYVDMAKNVLAGKGMSMSFDVFVADANEPSALQAPFYPFFLAAIFGMFGPSLLAVRLVQAIIGSVTCVVVYFLGRRIFSNSAGALAGLLAAVYPLMIAYVRPIMIETLHSFVVALLMLVFVITFQRVRQGRFDVALFILLGLFIGVAFPPRPDVLALLGVAALLALVYAWKQRPRQWSKAALGILTMGLACLALSLPWAVRNWVEFGELIFVPSKRWGLWDYYWLRHMNETNPEWTKACKTEDLLRCSVPNFESMTEIERDRYLADLGMQTIKSRPLMALQYSFTRLVVAYPLLPREELPPPLGYKGQRERPPDQYAADSLDDVPLYLRPWEKVRLWPFRIVFLLAIVGAIYAIKSRNADSLLLLAVIAINFALAFLLYGRERYRMLIDPYLILFAAVAVVRVARQIGLAVQYRRRERRVIRFN